MISTAPQGLFVGLCTLDILYSIGRVPLTNEKATARRQAMQPGGPCTNAALAFARLGGRAALATLLGCHPMSAVIRHYLTAGKLQFYDLLADYDQPPSVATAMVQEDTGERALISAHSTRLPTLPQQFPAGLLEGVDILQVDGHHMTAALAACRLARARGITTVLDGGSWKPRTEELLRWIDIAICSADFRAPDSEDTHHFLLTQGVQAAVVTRGPAPVLWRTAAGAGEVAVPPVRAVDTLGAGDVFHGAFCHAWVSTNGDLTAALAQAAAVAAAACTRFGL